jgi:hypothetical protein
MDSDKEGEMGVASSIHIAIINIYKILSINVAYLTEETIWKTLV